MSDTDSSTPNDLDQLFAAPGAAPSVPTAKVPDKLSLNPNASEDVPSPEEARIRSLQRFANLVHMLTPVAWLTPLLVLSNVAVFVAMVSQGINPMLPTAPELVTWGANYAPLTWSGQPWRLVTNMFLHCGLFHLAFNMWALWSIGRFLEKLVGNVGLAVIYFSSGITGSMASLWWNGDVVSAGASGAIFGLMGALASFLWNRADTIPAGTLSAMRGSIGTCILYNLLFGAAIEGIDQAAHVGGLLGGLICGALLSQPLDQKTRQRRVTKNAIATAVCGLVIGIMILQHPAPPPDFFQEAQTYYQVVLPSLNGFKDKADAFDKESKGRLASAKSLEEKLETNKITKKQFEKSIRELNESERVSRQNLANWIENELLPPWIKVREHFETLSNVPTRRRDLLHQMRMDLITREEGWNLLIEFLKRGDKEKLEEYKEKEKQANLLEEKLITKQ